MDNTNNKNDVTREKSSDLGPERNHVQKVGKTNELPMETEEPLVVDSGNAGGKGETTVSTEEKASKGDLAEKDSRSDQTKRKYSGAARRRYRKEQALTKGQQRQDIPTTSEAKDAGRQGWRTTRTKQAGHGAAPRAATLERNRQAQGEYKKRPRSPKETPSPVTRHPKKIREERHGGSTYAETVKDLPKLAIVHEDACEKITQEQFSRIQEGLMEIVDGILERDFIPRFQESYLNKGAIRIVCADQQTEVWLRGNVANLKVWEGARLKVVNSSELPKYLRILAWIPGPPTETPVILKRLQRQNPGLQTGGWLVHER